MVSRPEIAFWLCGAVVRSSREGATPGAPCPQGARSRPSAPRRRRDPRRSRRPPQLQPSIERPDRRSHPDECTKFRVWNARRCFPDVCLYGSRGPPNARTDRSRRLLNETPYCSYFFLNASANKPFQVAPFRVRRQLHLKNIVQRHQMFSIPGRSNAATNM